MSSAADTAVIGLTGQSGAGKTTVCGVFAENGFSIIDADRIAEEVMERARFALRSSRNALERISSGRTEVLTGRSWRILFFRTKQSFLSLTR